MKVSLPLLVMASLAAIFAAAPAVAQPSAAPVPRKTVTQAQFDRIFKAVSNWGRWGF